MEKIKWLEPLLKKLYGKKYSIEYTYDIINVVLHYPKITIKNSLNHKHDIKDFYVVLSFFNVENQKVRLNSLTGLRTTFSVEEARSGYWHSHLPVSFIGPRELFYSSRDFCLGGSGTPISSLYAQLQYEDSDEDIVEVFLLQLSHYLAWESLEGGPYIKIASIGLPFDSKYIIESQEIATSIINEVKEGTLKLPLTYRIMGNVSTVIAVDTEDPEFVKIVNDRAATKGVIRNNEFVITTSFKNLYSSYMRNLDQKYRKGTVKTDIKFKGIKLCIKVEKPKPLSGHTKEELQADTKLVKEVAKNINRILITASYKNQYNIINYGTIQD